MANEIQELKFQVGEAWKGVYSSSTAYGLANVVQDPTGLSIYRSLKSGNVGHPLSNASWWFCIIDMSSIKAESDRIAALNQAIAQDEALRVAAEELRQQHEAERVAAETQRNENEQARISAEQARVNAESARATAEQQRITAEQGRVSAESARVQAEQARVLAETLRANAEDQRAANEQNRIAAEQQRIERAEQDHQRAESDHATYVDSLGAFDISSYHATDGVLAKYADLTAALGTDGANIPDDLRKGGMSVKFVQSSDNKYVQYRLTSNTFTITPSEWQKQGAEVTVSQNSQTGHTDITIGSTTTPVASVEDIEGLQNEIGIITVSYLSGRLIKYVNAEANTNYLIEFKSCNNENITSANVFAYDDSSSLDSLGTVNVNGKLSVKTPTGTTRLFLFNSTRVSAATTAVFKITDDVKADIDGIETQISNLQTDKVDKVTGKGLSTNDFTDDYKSRIDEAFGTAITEIYTFVANKKFSKYIAASANKKYKITFICDNSEWSSARFIACDDSGSLGVEVTINRNSSGYLETPTGTTRILCYNGTSTTAQETNVSVTLALNGIIDDLETSVDDLETSVGSLSASSILDKKIMVFGDSLSEFDTYDAEEGKAMGWVDYANELGGIFIMGAIGGMRLMARHSPTDTPTTNDELKGNLDISNLIDSWIADHWTGVDESVSELGLGSKAVTNLKANPLSSIDGVVIMGGYNDLFSKVALGTSSDTSKTTSTCGALYNSIASLLAAKPKLKLYFVIEPPFYYGSALEYRVDEQWCDVQYSDYNTGIEFHDALASVCKMMRIPYCDLYYGCGWNKVNFPAIYGTTGNADNHHPRQGWKIIAERIHSFIQANL